MDYETERAAHPKAVDIVISTRVPSKWRFVDLESGDIWQWVEGVGFKRALDMEIDDMTDHIVDQQLKPQLMAKKLQDEGFNVDTAFVYTGEVVLGDEDFIEVACQSCGRKAQMEAELVADKIIVCPQCMDVMWEENNVS